MVVTIFLKIPLCLLAFKNCKLYNDISMPDHRRISHFENDRLGAYDLSITPELSELTMNQHKPRDVQLNKCRSI